MSFEGVREGKQVEWNLDKSLRGLGGEVAVVISQGGNERLLVGAMSKNEFKQLQSNFNNVCYVGSNRWRNAPCDPWTVASCACQIKDTSFLVKTKITHYVNVLLNFVGSATWGGHLVAT